MSKGVTLSEAEFPRGRRMEGAALLRTGYAVFLLHDGAYARCTPVRETADEAHLDGLPLAEAHAAQYVVRQCADWLQ